MPQVVLYRGTIMDARDPTGQGRMRASVPSLGLAAVTGWAKVYVAPPGAAATVPAVGDTVLTAFELGNLNYPVVFPLAAGGLVTGLMLLRAMVIDLQDPLAKGRMNVRVPALSDDQTTWAPACTLFTRASAQIAAVGSAVVVAFDYGDRNYPIILGALK